jgi:glutamate-1-semialdehyde 2,1-aminomutase
MKLRQASEYLHKINEALLPGGVVSINRKVLPKIAFVRGKGAHLWDADGNRYIDYHAAFGPYLLGHNAEVVEDRVRRAQMENWTLTGSGTTPWEGLAAELLVKCVPTLERVQFTNTGSEATALAIRLARAASGRDHIVVMQGGYSGWQDEVACNVMTPLESIGPVKTEGEYAWVPMSAGIPVRTADYVHVIEFNSLKAVEWVFQTYPVASIQPDLAFFGKAIANGYPLAALGGRAEIMDLFNADDPKRRVMISGTDNGHPIPMAAAIGTMEFLLDSGPSFYAQLDSRTAYLTSQIEAELLKADQKPTIVRQGSAFCVYFMDHAPTSWHDIALHHDMDTDVDLRKGLIDEGIYVFPVATKQWSVSSAHTESDFEATIEALANVLARK